ncbi:MAG: hypothetical protein V3V59_02915 [Thermodesulfovibrionales bacterium]
MMITEINGFVLEDPIEAVRRSKIRDHDKDGVWDLKVKFSRRKLVPLLSVGEQQLTITGLLNDGADFEGIGYITTKKAKSKKKCRKKWR